MNPHGDATGVQITTQNATKSAGLTKAEQVAAAGYQLVREFFPSRFEESDAATRVRLSLLGEVVSQVGPDAYEAAIRACLRTARNRNDVTVAAVREAAGLREARPRSDVADAWAFACEVFERHARIDPEGRYRLEPRYHREPDGSLEKIEVPEIPPDVASTIAAMGGWGALADRSNWSFRYRDFKELYRPEPAKPSLNPLLPVL